jgi:hypothetical protein
MSFCHKDRMKNCSKRPGIKHKKEGKDRKEKEKENEK